MVQSGINLSETFKLTKSQCQFSPNGRFIANASQFRLVVREFETLQIVTVLTCIDSIDLVLWSPNSKMVLTCCYKRGISQLWSLDESKCISKLDEGASGLVDALWCPDSKQVLTWCEFGVRINVWSLAQKRVSYIQNPVLGSRGCLFTGHFAVVLERRDKQESVSVFDYRDWKLVSNFTLGTDDVTVCHVVNGHVFVADSKFNPQYFVYTLKGSCVARGQLCDVGLGMKCVGKSLSEQFVVVGCFDGSCRLVNSVTWSVLCTLKHAQSDITDKTVCYREERSESGSRFGIAESDYSLPVVKANHDDKYLLVGVGLAQFSPSGRYLATRSDSSPTVLWIWDMESLSVLSLLSHAAPVVAADWTCREGEETLAITTNGDHVYLWSGAGVLAVRVPNCSTLNGAGELGPVRGVAWSGKGNCLALRGDYHFCLCYFPSYRE